MGNGPVEVKETDTANRVFNNARYLIQGNAVKDSYLDINFLFRSWEKAKKFLHIFPGIFRVLSRL